MRYLAPLLRDLSNAIDLARTRKDDRTISTFEDLGLKPALLRALADMQFTTPTPIQVQAIPPALEGRDVLASAQTGSGKSAAFGLPILEALLDLPRGKTRALVLAPTRELAEQICAHLRLLAKHTDIRVAPVYGGVAAGPQITALRTGADIVVATPGRLWDHMQSGKAPLGHVTTVVLDEADRMLDIGFLPIVRRILSRIETIQQILFFSATMPPAIDGLVRDILVDPVRVELALEARNVETLTQKLYAVPQELKTALFIELLKDDSISSAIAFTRTKARANRLAIALQKANIPVALMHGDRSQGQRERALGYIKSGRVRVLVATDIAARGIDIHQLGHVVNFDVPLAAEDYVHRVGRTARAQATGDAITFAADDEEPLIRRIEYIIGKRIERSVNPLLPEASVEAPKPRMVYQSKVRRR